MIGAIPKLEIDDFAAKIGFTPEELIRKSLIAFIWNSLQEVKIEVLQIQKKYSIDTPDDFEKLYVDGVVEEKDTWEDYQRFDHLFYKLEIMESFFKQLA